MMPADEGRVTWGFFSWSYDILVRVDARSKELVLWGV